MASHIFMVHHSNICLKSCLLTEWLINHLINPLHVSLIFCLSFPVLKKPWEVQVISIMFSLTTLCDLSPIPIKLFLLIPRFIVLVHVLHDMGCIFSSGNEMHDNRWWESFDFLVFTWSEWVSEASQKRIPMLPTKFCFGQDLLVWICKSMGC